MNSIDSKHVSGRAGLRIGFDLRGSIASNRRRRQRPSHALSKNVACRAARSERLYSLGEQIAERDLRVLRDSQDGAACFRSC